MSKRRRTGNAKNGDTLTQVANTMAMMSAVALHREFGFGPKRQARFQEALNQTILDYGDLLMPGDSDYADEKLREAYRAAVGPQKEENV